MRTAPNEAISDTEFEDSIEVTMQGEGEKFSEETLRRMADEIVKTVELELNHTQDDRHRLARLHFELGYIEEEFRKDNRAARIRYRTSLKADENFTPALRALQRVEQSFGNITEAIKLQKQQIAQAPNDSERATAYVELGRLREERQEIEEAIDAYRSALELEPSKSGAFESLIALFQAKQQWVALSETLLRAAGTSQDPVRRAYLTMRAGLVRDALLAQEGPAEALLATAIRHCPRQPTGKLISSITEELDAYELGITVDSDFSIEEDEESVRPPDEEDSLVEAPDSRLCHAGGPTGTLGQLTSELARLYRKRDRWLELAQLEKEEALLSTSPEQKVLGLYRAGRLYAERVGDPDVAEDCFSEAISLSPKDPLSCWALAEIQQRRGNVAKLENTLVETLTRESERDRVLALLVEIARLRLEKLDRPDDAIVALKQALGHDPHYVPALRALEDIFIEQGRYQELVDVVQSEVNRLRSGSARADAYFELGQLVEQHLKDGTKAAFLYRAALDLVPGHCPALESLDRLLSAEKRWPELVELLEESSRATPDSKRAAARLFRAAQICEHRLDDANRAIELTLELIRIRRDDLDAVGMLGRLLERAERWNERIEWLHREVKLSDHEPEQLALLMSIGAIYESRLDSPDQARDLYRQVIAREPQNRGALRALERLDRRSGRYEGLLETLRLQLDTSYGQEESATVYYRMGRILDDRLGRADDAISNFRAALTNNPRYRPAADALERLLNEQGRWDELTTLIEEQARHGTDRDIKRLDWYRVGELKEEKLKDEEGARKAYLEALAIDPDFEPARAGILRILAGQSQWPSVDEELSSAISRTKGTRKLVNLFRLAMVRILRTQELRSAVSVLGEASTLAPGDVAVHESLVQICRTQRLWERLGSAYNQLSQTLTTPVDAAAILHRAVMDAKSHPAVGNPLEIYKRILILNPHDREAMLALESQALKSGDHRALLRATDRLLMVEVSPAQQVVLLTRKGMLLTALGDEKGAFRSFSRAYEIEPSSIPVLKNLARILKSQKRYEELADLYEQEARYLKDPKAKTEAWFAAGTIRLTKLSKKESAADCFAKIMELEPGHPEAFQMLSEILEESGRWSDLAEAIRARLATTADDSDELSLRLRLSTIEREKLGSPETALRTLAGLLSVDPNNDKALESQGDLYIRVERWREASESYERAVTAASANSDKKAALRCRYKLAELQFRKLEEFDLAVKTLHEALALDLSDSGMLRLLIEVQRRRGDYSAVASALNQLAGVTPAGERAEILVELSLVLRDHLNDMKGAGEALQRAVVDHPEEDDPIHRLREHYGRQQDWKGLAKGLTWIVDQLGTELSVTSNIRIELAKTLIERLDNVNLGVDHLESVLSVNPAHAAARFAMARRHLLPPGRPDLAEQQYRAVLAENPWNVEALRLLFGLLTTGQDPRRAMPVGLLLAYLGDTDAAKVARGTRLHHRSSLGPEGYHKWIAEQKEPIVMCNLLRAVQCSLERVYPPDLDRHGASREDRSVGTDPLTPTIGEVAKRIGVETWEVYISQRNRQVCAIEPGDPPKIIVGVGLRNLSDGTRRFELGRIFGSVVGGFVLFSKVPRREIPSLMSAIIATNVRGYSRMGQPSEVMDLTKRVSKALSRKLRRALEDDARKAAQMPPPDIDSWLVSVTVSADRCGLLACADIGAALDAVRSREEHRCPLPHESFDHRLAALRHYQPAETLAKYWLSTRCEEALRQLGTF